MSNKKNSNRAAVGEKITMKFGTNQRKRVSKVVNKQNITPHDFIIKAGVDAAEDLLNAPR
ncbi:hypothetical protein [Endozoicomonas sp. GU-1]|uniref:hypothetical protein n=1 Tax=Endozoicomonas sp. GU-1 TaxID=3009078 RepID=UPI0022B38F72|nr:hypothetical protein [Endozoicomonas sp. GU-1]WBA81947.1 hypothetical protein O2T12_01905 [Endozoicomonas sp. GU-1]WBA84897.1 hypothetical protein O3276_16685 [Endozoicomonas sp. GU-1]